MKTKIIGAVIVAGGLSSRMKDFKPLLKIDKKTMIETTASNFIKAGVDRIVVVTGHRSQDIEKQLAGYNIKCIKNENYRTTHMFDSVCIGLKELGQDADMVFVTPSDSPFVQQFTLKKMIDEVDLKNIKAAQPSYEGTDGHPVLLSAQGVKEVLGHNGVNGMQGALDNMEEGFLNIPFVDPGITLDADTPIDYFKLLEFGSNMHIPSTSLCLKMYEYFNVPQGVREHSVRVAMEAVNICEILDKKGIQLNRRLVASAALLHDIAKGHPRHSSLGAKWLLEMGYEEMSTIVLNHANIEYVSETPTEVEVVYLADKMVKGTEVVSIKERFKEKEEIYKNDKDILKNIERREACAMKLFNEVFSA